LRDLAVRDLLHLSHLTSLTILISSLGCSGSFGCSSSLMSCGFLFGGAARLGFMCS